MDLVELTTQIVSNQASRRDMSAQEIAQAIKEVYIALQTCSEGFGDMTPNLTTLRQHPQASIGSTLITCLECGAELKLLSNRHLHLHGLNPTTYKEKYGLLKGQPLSSKVLTNRRRKLAKASGMGSALAQYRADKKQQNLDAQS